jgi:hypothetical protein
MMARTANIGMRVEPALKDALEEAAAADHRSVASYIERLIIAHLTAEGYLNKEAKPAGKKPANKQDEGGNASEEAEETDALKEKPRKRPTK